ncbi:MAG TPA: flavodoxin family protein [Clostridiales bacterium]|nr:flavodoxin family protein [Clostridiales bacterium]
MILIVNTTTDLDITGKIRSELDKKGTDFCIMEAGEKKIGHCIGCNYCWLKDPGVCTVKDDMEEILRKAVISDQIWVITDSVLDFVSPKAKNVVDRLIPLATMYLKFEGNQMRHVLRYGKGLDFGVIVKDVVDMEYMGWWSERVAVNFGGKSKGAFRTEETEEAVRCMCS